MDGALVPWVGETCLNLLNGYFNWHISVYEISLQKQAKCKHEIVINKLHVETLEKVENLFLQCPLKAQQQKRG